MDKFLAGFLIGFGCGSYYAAYKLGEEKPAEKVFGFVSEDASAGASFVKEKTVNGVQYVKDQFKKKPEAPVENIVTE